MQSILIIESESLLFIVSLFLLMIVIEETQEPHSPIKQKSIKIGSILARKLVLATLSQKHYH